ncbi:MAG: DUF481 domain-containing protein [Phycisphaerales bacterium]|jgi:putative salt-induced outer membrane protein YdiY|nr:DUF481 domain-containing protein [Phycisphaerales bacterium]
MRRSLCLFLAAAFVGTPVFADEIQFNNGDRLTGTIVDAGGGKLKIKTAVAGEITVDMKDVKTFSTDHPVELQLEGGATLNQKAQAGEAGQIKTEEGQNVSAQTIELNKVKAINPPKSHWTGTVVASGLVTTGNTQNQSLSINFNASRRTDDDRLSLGAGYLFSRQKDPTTGQKSTTADSWFALTKYDYFINDKWYAYGQFRVERDRIADLDLRMTPGGGIGYQWIERPDFNFYTEGGLNWVYETYRNGGSNDHVAARLAYHVDKKLNSAVSVFHNLEFLPSVEDISDFNVNADIGVRADLTEKMFTELKAEWRHDATPAAGKMKNDIRYLMGVGWNF